MVKVLLDYNNGNGVFYVVHAKMLQAGQFEAMSHLLGRVVSSSVESSGVEC
jgi:hypothetical protein